jgi:hypothetical protein
MFAIFILFGLLNALGFVSESARGGFYISLPILTAGWFGAHAKENGVEPPISITLVFLLLFLLPIGIAYYFFKNFERKKAAIMFFKTVLVGVLLLCTPAALQVFIENNYT